MAPRPYSVDGRSYGVVCCVAIHPSKMTFGWRYVYYEPDFFIGPQVTISHAKISSGLFRISGNKLQFSSVQMLSNKEKLAQITT